jgi:ammonia channel protein AmtB
VFGYTRRLIWSGIGFTFFITALSLEIYPLVNAFWTKVGLQSQNVPMTDFSYDQRNYSIFLANRDTSSVNTAAFYGNCMTNALKCALSLAVAFSSVLGRVGHLECLLLVLFGTVGYELNRQIIQESQGADAFGTFYIFTFGGFMGLTAGLLTLVREKKMFGQESVDNSREAIVRQRVSMDRYTGREYSVLYALFGSLIIFALFPFLTYEIDSYIYAHDYSTYTNPLNLILAMGAGAIGAILMSLLINGKIIARDAVHGPIAGAISVGASTLYITAPHWALVAGCAGGLIQSLIQNLIERSASKKGWIASSVSWSLFGVQGLVGAGFAAGWKALIFSNKNGLIVNEKAISNFSSQFEFYSGLISAGIGAGFGLGLGMLFIILNNQ